MRYPKVLVSRFWYKKLSSKDLSGNSFFLARATPSRTVLNPSTGNVSVSVLGASKYLLDFSVNLVGPFTPSYVEVKIIKPKLRKYSAEWNECEFGRTPKKNELEQDLVSGVIFFNYDKLENFPFQQENPSDKVMYKYFCKVVHMPTLANFWHFELHWFNDDGERIIRDEKKDDIRKKDFPKKIKTEFRNLHSELALDGLPENTIIKTPLQSHYQKPLKSMIPCLIASIFKNRTS